MKKIIILTMFLFAISHPALPQDGKWGVKIGGNLSSLTNYTEQFPNDDYKFKLMRQDGNGLLLGYHAGLFANLKMGNFVRFQPELLYSMQGGRLIQSDEKKHSVLRMGYVQLPLLLEIKPKLNSNFGILVGAQLGLNISRKMTRTYSDDYWARLNETYPDHGRSKSEVFRGPEFDDQIYRGALDKFDAAVVLGAQYTIQRILVGVRYNYGIVNAKDEVIGGVSYKGLRSNVIQASIGYVF